MGTNSESTQLRFWGVVTSGEGFTLTANVLTKSYLLKIYRINGGSVGKHAKGEFHLARICVKGHRNTRGPGGREYVHG